MPEQNEQVQQDSPKPQESQSKQLILSLVIVAVAVAWGIKNPSTALRVLAVMLGFGGIIMIHEFGHFIVAKFGGIKVEAFSIGMGPVVLGIRKLKKGWKIRLLPKIGEEQVVEEGDNETEYQIALLPIGGFVRMLGQSDTGAADESDDPRSYSNRPVWIRICVVSAGVIFNAVGAIIIFMILFMNGIDLKPAVVGRVLPNSPAYDVGLEEGDRIVEVNGERFVDFESILLAPALSKPGEPITFVKQLPDGAEEDIQIVAEKRAGDPSNLRYTGISPASTLTVEPMLAQDPQLVEEIYELTGLYPGDQVKTLNGTAVSTPWDFEKQQAKIFQPEVQLGVSRQWPTSENPDASRTMITVSLPMEVAPVLDNFREEYDLANFCSLVPRLKVKAISEPAKVTSLFGRIKRTILRQPDPDPMNELPVLQEGDILVKAGNQDFPNFKQLREQVTEFKDKPMPVTVLRPNEAGVEQLVEATVYPRSDPGSDRVLMGIAAVLDMETPVVAQVISGPGQTAISDIPTGATIVAVDGHPVSSFYEIATRIQESSEGNREQRVSIDYEFEGKAGGTAVMTSKHEPIHARASIATGLPFSDLNHEYKASNPIEATQMGLKKAWQFVWRSYVTLGRLFQRSVPVSALSGPVGIISMTYQVAGGSLDHYLYFLGLISSCLAVMNLLPLPVLDGGHIVILLIEKISGKPINERILATAMYAGMALLLGLVLVITYHDLIRILFGR
ncbi:MAG: site-2 protease family protein [Planctomycetota bacterium]|jgi:regulator of sigma E protease